MAALYCLGVGALSCDNPVTNGKISPGFGGGFSFAADSACIVPMDPDLEKDIRQVLEDALAAGKGDGAQTLLAVQAVQRARPDMTVADAKAVVKLVQQE